MKIVTLLFALFWSLQSLMGQHKPRRFITAAAICPIDYSSLSTLGVSNANQLTVDIITTNSNLNPGDRLPLNAVSTGRANSIRITDTTFKYKLLSESGLVFEIVQEIGSFTVIRFWSYKSGNAAISEY